MRDRYRDELTDPTRPPLAYKEFFVTDEAMDDGLPQAIAGALYEHAKEVHDGARLDARYGGLRVVVIAEHV